MTPDPSTALFAGLAMQIPLALAGMMAAFNWASFKECGDQDGARSYRNNAILVIAAMCAQPLIVWLLHGEI